MGAARGRKVAGGCRGPIIGDFRDYAELPRWDWGRKSGRSSRQNAILRLYNFGDAIQNQLNDFNLAFCRDRKRLFDVQAQNVETLSERFLRYAALADKN